MGLPDDIIIPSDDGTGNVTPNNQTIVTPAVDDTTGAESNTPNPGDPDELMFPGWANKVPSATKTDQTDNKPSNTSQLKQEKKSEEKKTNNNKKTDKDKGEKDKKEEKKDDPDEGGIKLPKPPTINESPKIASTDTPSTPYQIQPAADPKPVPPTLAQKIQDNKSDNAQQQQNPAGQQAQNPAGQQTQNPAGQQQPQNPTSQQQPQNPASQQQPQNAVNQQQQPPASQQQQQNPANQQQPQSPANQQQPQTPASQQQQQNPASQQQQTPASQQQQQNPANQQQPQTPASQQQPQPPANQQQPQTPASQQQQTPASQQQQQNPASTSSSSGSEKSIGESIVQAGKMIGGGWADSATKIFDAWDYDGEGTESHRFSPADFDANYQASQAKFKTLDMSKLPPKTSNHTALMGMEICTENCIVKCAMGTVFTRLHVMDPSRMGFIGKDGPRNRFATVMDFVPGVNFEGFSLCWNLLNPVVLASTIATSIAAGMFVLTPAPCIPTMMPSPWPLVQPPVLYKGKPLLVNTNISICWGLGFIQVVHCGQGQGPGFPGFSDGNGHWDWHAIAATAANIAGALALPFAVGSKLMLAGKIIKNMETAIKAGAILKNVAIGANVLSAGITVADGVGYLAQGQFLEAGLSIGLGGLGIKSGVSELGQGAKALNGLKEAAKAGKIPPVVMEKLGGVKGIANNPVAIRKIIQNNPETFGEISKLPTKELDKLIKSSGFSESIAASIGNKGKTAKVGTNTAKVKPTQSPLEELNVAKGKMQEIKNAEKALPNAEKALKKAQDAKKALPDAEKALTKAKEARKALPDAEKALTKAKEAKIALPDAEKALTEAKNAKKALPAAEKALERASQAEKELPGLERQLANAKAAEGQIENAKTAVAIAKDAAEKLPGEEAALKAMKENLASLEKEFDEMSKSADSLEDLSHIDGLAEKYQEIARLRQAITDKTTHIENLKNTANLLEDAEANLKRVKNEAGKIEALQSQVEKTRKLAEGKEAAKKEVERLSELAAKEEKAQKDVTALRETAAKEKEAQKTVTALSETAAKEKEAQKTVTALKEAAAKEESAQKKVDGLNNTISTKGQVSKDIAKHQEHLGKDIGLGLALTTSYETGMTGSSMYDWSQENNDGKVKDRNADLGITPDDLNKYNRDFEEELKQKGLIEPDMDFSKYDFSLLDD